MIRQIFRSVNCQIRGCNASYFRLISLRRISTLRQLSNASRTLKQDSSKPLPTITFADMFQYGQPIKPPTISTTNSCPMYEEKAIKSTEFVRQQLELLCARIITDFQNLPYGVSQNEHIQRILNKYIESYSVLKQIPNIKTIQHQNQFHQTLDKYLSSWTQASVVPNLCLGLLETKTSPNGLKYLHEIADCPYLSSFIDRIIKRRLAARLLIGQYSAIQKSANSEFGIFETNCQIINYLKSAINDSLLIANTLYDNDKLPKINITDKRQHKSAIYSFTFIPKIIHQFSFELIKNSIRAIMENNKQSIKEDPEINIIIVNSKNGDTTIKITDNGGGISRNEMDKIWLYSYTSFKSKSQNELLHKSSEINKNEIIGCLTHPNDAMFGLGYGLSLVKAYSNYFGGQCQIHSIDGYGTDAYLFFPSLNLSNSNVLS